MRPVVGLAVVERKRLSLLAFSSPPRPTGRRRPLLLGVSNGSRTISCATPAVAWARRYFPPPPPVSPSHSSLARSASLIAIGWVRRHRRANPPLGRVGRGTMENLRRNLRAEDGYALATSPMLLVRDLRRALPRSAPSTLLCALSRGGAAGCASLGRLALVFFYSASPCRLGGWAERVHWACALIRPFRPTCPVVSKAGRGLVCAGRVEVGTPGTSDPVRFGNPARRRPTSSSIASTGRRDWERFLEPSIGGAGPQFAVVARASSDSNVRILRWTVGP